MKLKRIIALIITTFLIGTLSTFHLLNTVKQQEIDTVAINEIVKKIENNWGQLNKEELHIKQQIAVIDVDGNVLYRTSKSISQSINDAIKNRDTIVDLTVNNKMVGKVIIYNNTSELQQQTLNQIQTILIIIFMCLTTVCISYLIYLNKVVFKPFKRLKDFAKNIARGHFDVPLHMHRNNLFGAFTESFDLMREELAKAKHNEYLANRSKKELVASLSHDIKTPVATIKAVSELMLVQTADDKKKKQLHTIYSKAEQIDLLITDMFHATLEELNEFKVNLNEEYSTVLTKIITEVDYKGRIVMSEIPNCLILTDVMRLQQVFDNIISNSYKYADTKVTIDFSPINDYLEVIISDYGNGVNKDDLPLLFNKFYRGQNAEKHSGAGLGLYISKYLMQKMQGDIVCYSRENGFTVILKIKIL